MITIFLLLFLFRRHGTRAAPIASPGAFAGDTVISPRDDSSDACDGRSVWDIFWSCLATTFAVTWVSVHPNVPFLEETSWAILRRRVFLMILALLVPEVMIMWAFKQWRGAKLIREIVNKACPGSSGRKWTMKHAHFFQMGGFRLVCIKEVKDEIDELCFDDVLREDHAYRSKYGQNIWEGVLLFKSFCELLENHEIGFPETTEEEIDDRSKGDALSKGFALLQITWFIIQLIARARQGLVITEIELTTAALAGLNSVMYLFWWNKPLDVQCAIVIRTKELERLLARRPVEDHDWEFDDPDEFRLSDCITRDYKAFGYARVAWLMVYFVFYVILYLSIARLVSLCLKRVVGYFQSSFRYPIERLWAMLDLIACSIRSGLLQWMRIVFKAKDVAADIQVDTHLTQLDQVTADKPSSEDDHPSTGKKDQIRLSYVLPVLKKLFYLPYLLMFMPMDQIFNIGIGNFKIEQFKDAKDKVHQKPTQKLLFNEDDMKWIMSMIFHSESPNIKALFYFSAFAGAAFGSIHCAAWNFDFPSYVEEIMWRTASLVLVGVCIAIPVVASTCISDIVSVEALLYDALELSEFKASSVLMKVLVTIPAILYPISRLSLLILALLSLRDIPDSALQNVTWTKFIPHI